MSSFSKTVYKITNDLAELLISKNKKYGNSALEPVRVFSKANAIEQLLVRIDDKLSRLRTQSITEDEDVLEDLLGYLVLLKIAMQESPKELNEESPKPVLGKKFALRHNAKKLIPSNTYKKLVTSGAFLNSSEELKYSYVDSDGNVILKDYDITLPLKALTVVS